MKEAGREETGGDPESFLLRSPNPMCPRSIPNLVTMGYLKVVLIVFL